MKNIITADYAMRNTPGTVRRNSAMRRLLPALSGMKVIMTTLTITIMDIIGLLNLIAIILRTAVTAQFAMQRKATTTVRRSFATRRLLLALSGMKNVITADYAMWNITRGSVRRNFAMRRLLPAFSGMKNIITADYAMRHSTGSVRRSFAMRRLVPAFSGMKNIITADYAMRNTIGTVRRSFAMQ